MVNTSASKVGVMWLGMAVPCSFYNSQVGQRLYTTGEIGTWKYFTSHLRVAQLGEPAITKEVVDR